jgi:hypothetical protein
MQLLGMKTLMTGLGALTADFDDFEKNNESIHVTNDVGSRFLGYFKTNAGPLCSKIENGNKRELGAKRGLTQIQKGISGGTE